MPYKYPIHPYPVPPNLQPARPTLEDYARERNAVTEIFFLRLRPDARIEDPSTPEGKLWKKTLDSIRGSDETGQSAQPGFGRLYWGRCEGEGDEDGDVVILMIDWDDLSLHQQHQHQHQSQSQPSIPQTLSPLLLSDTSTSTTCLQTKLTPYPPLTASATTSPPYPLVALTVATFPSTVDPDEKAQIPALFGYTNQDRQPRGNVRKYGCLGAAGGWGTSITSMTGMRMGKSSGEGKGEGEEERVLGAETETGSGSGTGIGTGVERDGKRGCYVMLDAWKEKKTREEWEGREEARLLRCKWEERATEGLRTWFVRLRLCQREGGRDGDGKRDTGSWVDI